jgi:hypothetical protein
MDWKDRLSLDSTEQLKQRRINANGVLEKHEGTAKAVEAENLLSFIEAELAARSMPGSIASFLDKNPKGFLDSKFDEQERNDKIAASKACRTLLAEDALADLSQDNIAALLLAVKRIVGMTNLIQGGFEKPKLLDAIKDPKNSKPFLAELKDLLYGAGDSPERLERFSEYMHTLGLRKWTYATYFLFLHDPKNCMFVKPEGLKKAAEIAGFPLDYASEPTADRYRQVLDFAKTVERRLREQHDERLAPRDMIDVQSFIWHMAPTGKFAR